MDLIQFQKICPIPHLSDDYSLVARSVANDHSLLFLFVERAGESAVTSTFQSGIGTFPRIKNGRSKTILPAEATSGSLETIELPKLDVTFPLVDIFPDGSQDALGVAKMTTT